MIDTIKRPDPDDKFLRTILLVDDDEDFLDAQRVALELADYRVLVAHDAHEALCLARRHALDGAVLDVMMTTPDEGFRLARRLRKLPGTRGLPLIMVSSINTSTARQGRPLNLSDADRDETWLPVDRFLDKPVSPPVLLGVLRELVG